MRSMPTSETRTHASMTMPLSSTRSRTSIRLVPPAARSTGIEHSLSQSGSAATHQRRQLALERTHLLLQFLVLSRQCLLAGRQMMIELPPIQPDLLRLVNGANQKADTDCQELDFCQRDLDVARDHEALVEHAIENVNQTCG